MEQNYELDYIVMNLPQLSEYNVYLIQSVIMHGLVPFASGEKKIQIY